MPAKKYKRHKRYGGGTIAPTPHGTFMATVQRAGVRKRQSCESEAVARAWIDATVAEMETRAAPLEAWQLREAREALAMLPQGVGLVEAARAWLEAHQRAAVTIKDAVKKFLEEKQDAGARDKTRITYGSLLGALAKEFGALAADEVDGAALLDWLARRKIKGTTRDNYRRAIHTFFAWSVRAGWRKDNPALAITRGLADETMPQALRPREVWLMLRAGQRLHPELVPYLALAAFAGVRPQELTRLHWSAVDLAAGRLHVGPEAAKLRRQRYVSLAANLKAWLKAYPPATTGAPLVPYGFRRVTDVIVELREAAGLQHWPADALRHSFATYFLALHKDAARTAHEMGNSPTVLFRHYRNLATEAQGRRYFAIHPRAPGGNKPRKKPRKV